MYNYVEFVCRGFDLSILYLFFRNVSSYLECFHSETSGCNLIQLLPLQFELRNMVDTLRSNNVSCEVPDLVEPEDPFAPLLQCVNDFIDDFSSGLTECYLPYGDTADLCKAAAGFKLCVYKIPDLPAKTAVAEMVQMTTKLYTDLCEPADEGQLLLHINVHSVCIHIYLY